MKSPMKLYIKNMVCPRCIEAVQAIFNELELKTTAISLGEVTVTEMNDAQRLSLSEQLSNKGFELLEDHKSKLINQIKALVIEQIHHQSQAINSNFSALISDQLQHDYSYLSRLFSSVEGITIEKYILKQKIERVKELIFYDELTLSEIAFQLGYSSVAYLSAQFKKETGMTPSVFRKLKESGRKSLDQL